MARRRLVNSYFYVTYNDQRAKKGGTITLSPFDATGGTDSFTIHSSKAWSMGQMPGWVSVSAENGEKGETIVFISAATNSDAARNGSTNISPTYFLGRRNITIAYSQDGRVVDYRNLTVDPTTMSLSTADTTNGKAISAWVEEWINGVYSRDVNITTSVTWSSANNNVADCQSVSGGEIVKPIYNSGQYYPSTRTTTVTASYLGSAATCSVSVAPQGLVEYTLEVSPTTVTINYDGTSQLTAMLRAYVDGVRDPSRDVNVTTSSTYQVTATSVSDLITIGSDGIVRGQNNPDGGTAIIQVSNSDASNTVDVYVTVNSASIAEYLEILPATTSTTWNGTVTYDVYYVKEIAGDIVTEVPITNINDLAFSLRNGTVGEMHGFDFNAANISTSQAYEEISVTCTAGTYDGKSTLTPASLTIYGANSVEYYIIIEPQKSALGYSDGTQLEVSGITLVDGSYYDVSSIPANEVSWSDDSPYASIDNIDNQVWLSVENTTNYLQTCSISGISLSSVGGGAYYNLSATTEVTIERQPEVITYDNLRFCYSGQSSIGDAITQLDLNEDDQVDWIVTYVDKYDNHAPLGTFLANSACSFYLTSGHTAQGDIVSAWFGVCEGYGYLDSVFGISGNSSNDTFSFVSNNYAQSREYGLVASGLGLNAAMDIDIDATSCVPNINLALGDEIAGGYLPQSGGSFTVSAITSGCAIYTDCSLNASSSVMYITNTDVTHIDEDYVGITFYVYPNSNKESGRDGRLTVWASGYTSGGAQTVSASTDLHQNKADWEITDADYITFKYNWSGDTGGKDLDTFTFIQFGDSDIPYVPQDEPGSWSGVGNAGQFTIPQSATISASSGSQGLLFDPDTSVLVWAGDNRDMGAEHTLIDLNDLFFTAQSLGSEDAFVYVFANWYTFMGTSGNCNIELTGWKGGRPLSAASRADGFIIEGGEEIKAKSEVSNVCYARRRGNDTKPLSAYTFMSVMHYHVLDGTVYLYSAENIDPSDPSLPAPVKQYWGKYGCHRAWDITAEVASGGTVLSSQRCNQHAEPKQTIGFSFSGESSFRLTVNPNMLYYSYDEPYVFSTTDFTVGSCTVTDAFCEIVNSGITFMGGGMWFDIHLDDNGTPGETRSADLRFDYIKPTVDLPDYNPAFDCDTLYIEINQYLP